MNKNYALKMVGSGSVLKKVFTICLLLQLFFLPRVNAQWSSLGAGSCDIVYAVSPDVTNTGIYFGMKYGNCGANNFVQHWNGSAVSNLNASCYVNGYIYAIAVSGNNVYVGGNFTKAGGVAGFNNIACWNTSTNTWSTLGTGVAGSNKTVYALTVDPATSTLYVGGEFLTANGTTVNNIASWSIGSSTWAALNPGTAGVSGVPGGSSPGAVAGVYALTYCANKLYAGGRFTSVNGATTVNNIAAWNGAAWSTLSSGGQIGVSNTTVVNPQNVASAVWDAPIMALTNDGTTVYAGGDFNKVNNAVGCNNIAAWNTGTSTWSTLGVGMTWPGSGSTATDNTYGDQANVYALTMYNGNLIAGGDFMKAGTVGGFNTSLFVAQWNGSAWSAMSTNCGGATESDVFCLTVSNGILYAGGQFPEDVPNTPANMWYVAQYSGAGPTVSLAAAPTNTICAGGSTVITASGGASSYSWSPATALSCTNCAAPTASPTVTTTYTVTGTLAGCSSTKTITVVVNPKPTLTLTPTSSTLCGSASSTTITAAGANTYTWTSATTLSSSTGTPVVATPTTTTTYTVNATDNNGCTNSKTVTITISPLPTLTLTAASPTICLGSNTTITASGASTYTWSPAATLSSPTGATVTATPTTTTNYTVNATNAAGCTNSETVTVTVNPLPTLTLTSTSSTVCAGITATLTAAGANTYTWSPAGSLSSSTGTPVVATPTTSTTYTVNGTDNNGCKNNQTITLNVNPLPTLTLSASSTTICSGNSATLTATGASTYTWSPTTTLSSSTGSPVVATPTANTTYTVDATDANGCNNNSTITINIAATPSLVISPSSTYTICLGDSVTMSVSGATTYTWSPATSLSSTTSATVTATPTASIVYNVNGTLAGCGSSAASATITVNLPPDITAHGSPQSICIGDSSKLFISGAAVSCTWTPSSSLSSAYGTPVVATPTVTTEYVVTATGSTGCTKTDSVLITVNPTPTITIVSGGGSNSQSVCSGATVNAITFNSAAGTTINWANTNTNIGIASTGTTNISSYTSPIVTTQQTGTITAIATDTTTGCSSSATNPPVFVVTINPLPIINATDSLTPGGCGGLANGCISNVSGQAPGTYQYSWDNGTTWSSNSQNCNIPAGNYTVSVKDTNGCVSQKTISLPTANAPSLPQVTGNPSSTCLGDTIYLSISSPQPTMTYTWTTPTGTATGTSYTITNVSNTGTYTVGLAVSDTNQCLNDTSLSFSVNAPPQPVISGNNHFCKGASTVLNAAPNGSSYTYQWNQAGTSIAGANSTSYTVVNGGVYGVTVTNMVTGCMHDTSITITVDSVPAAPTVTTNTSNNSYCQGQTTLNPIPVNGTGTFTWYSDSSLTTQIGTGSPFTPSVTVTSTLYVTASNSVCTSDSTPVVITINPLPPTPTITVGAGNSSYCQNQTINQIVASGPSTIVWYDNVGLTHVVDTGATFTPNNLPLGTTTYYLVDSSAAGCKSSSTATVSVTINQNPLITGSATIDSSLCSKNNGGVLGLSVQNGTPQYTYQWVNSSGTVVGDSLNLTNVGPGTYSLIVIDANLCRDTSSGAGYTVGGSFADTANFIPSIYEGQAPLAVTFSNTSVGATSYIWNFGTNTATSTQVNPSYTYTATGTYTVTLTASNGNCSDTARKVITIDVTEVLIIPNIFSPNGDAINDQFFITCVGIDFLNCDIYNRWGELIFTIKAPNQIWDGVMNNGNHATEGTYFYILQAKGFDGKEYKKNGTLTLVR